MTKLDKYKATAMILESLYKDEGLIGARMEWADKRVELHLENEDFAEMFKEYHLVDRGEGTSYKYERVAIVDGVKFVTLITESQATEEDKRRLLW